LNFLFERIQFVWVYNSAEYVLYLFFSSTSYFSIIRHMQVTYKTLCSFCYPIYNDTYVVYRGRYGIAGSPCRLLQGGELVRIY